MSFPELSFHMRRWSQDDFSLLTNARDRITSLNNEVGSSSDRFQKVTEDMLKSMMTSGQEAVLSELNSSMHIRAVTFLLLNSEGFRHASEINSSFLSALVGSRPAMSRLSLTQLIRFFFAQFNSGLNNSEFELLAQFIRQQLDALSHKIAGSDLGRLQKNSTLIFSLTGPDYIAKWAIDNNQDLDIASRAQGVQGFQGGQFDLLCRHKYYLETLKVIPVGEHHPILDEILKPTVHNIQIEPGRLLGHEALTILIGRADIKDVSEVWQNVVLTIAGDPRVHENSKNYQKWWAFIDEDLMKKVRAWLAKFDLKLFLQILEDSAHAMGIEDMERMFTSRKVFMEGMLEQGLVSDSRLFLSRNAQKYLRQNYKGRELPGYVRVNEADTSMIYLKVGKLHMLEGSHSFKVKVMKSVPLESSLLNYSVKEVKTTEFRVDLMRMYVREFIAPQVTSGMEIKKYALESGSGYFEATHDVGLNWQKNMLAFFRKNGVVVDPSAVLTEQQYVVYKRRFGLAVSHA